MITAGILMPRSTLYPSLGHDWLNGLKAFLKKQDQYGQFNFLTDNIGFGVDEQEVYTKAEKMLLQDDADLVILFADTTISTMLAPLFAATNKLLLVVNFGANFPESWQPAATTITHSLNFCSQTTLTGRLAASSGEKKAVNVASYYDAGYHQCFCMLNSHQQAGCIPLLNHVTHLKLEEFTLAPVEACLQENRAVKNLLCIFSAEQAEKFYKEIQALQKQHQLRLFVSPMMMDENLQLDDQSVVEARGYVPWYASLDNENNKLFKETIQKTSGKEASYFSLLGWETGILLEYLLMQGPLTNAAAVVQSMKGKQFESPAGRIKLDAATQYIFRPSYLVSRRGKTILGEGETGNAEEEWKLFSQTKLLPGGSSSWRNTYLCI